jgi:hypothetical protein
MTDVVELYDCSVVDEPRLETSPTALALLQAVYKNPDVPLSTRIRCAAIALPFETPKLTAIANISPEEFSDRLEKAIVRSGGRLIASDGDQIERAAPANIKGGPHVIGDD